MSRVQQTLLICCWFAVGLGRTCHRTHCRAPTETVSNVSFNASSHLAGVENCCPMILKSTSQRNLDRAASAGSKTRAGQRQYIDLEVGLEDILYATFPRIIDVNFL